MSDGAANLHPVSVEVGPAWVDGRPSHRLMVVLRAPGCSYARRTGGCTICGFTEHLSTRGAPVSSAELAAQLREAIESHQRERDALEHLDLYCSGSFFNDEELEVDARTALLRLAVRELPALRTLLVDTRPEFVTAGALAAAHAALGRAGTPVRLEVAIGLESADDEVRNRLIRKGFSYASFERAAEALAAAEAALAVYLLLKPPGLDEEAAIADVLASGRALVALRARLGLRLRVALEPTLVVEGTALHAEHLAGRYRSPSLWSVARAAIGLAALRLPVHVGLSDEGLPAVDRPRGCAACEPVLLAALRELNRSQDPTVLAALRCDCQSP